MNGQSDVFDRVVLAEGVSRRTLSPSEFFELPLADRLRFVLERRVTFFRGQQAIDPRQALASLRRLQAARN